ncbi:MAG: hypothetical protein NT027_00895 [Proteobacteria bacterium]|nr:hypothetical protein [Pseudomonadota bacterium]
MIDQKCFKKRISILMATVSSFIFSSAAPVGKVKLKVSDIPWATAVIDQVKGSPVTLCGTPDLILTKKSLAKDFFFADENLSYFAVNLVRNADFYEFMGQNERKGIEPKLKELFGAARFYSIHSKTLEIVDLGKPTDIEVNLTATILDCVNGAETSMGNTCSGRDVKQREDCCSEKFIGPTVYFGPERKLTLHYAPDPSVLLKVKGNKKGYYCHVSDDLYLKKAQK